MASNDIIEKLNYLNETKQLIKDELNNLGAEITDTDTFRSYVTKIGDLYNEYPTEEQVQNIQLQNIQLQSIQPQILSQPTLLDTEIGQEIQEQSKIINLQDELDVEMQPLDIDLQEIPNETNLQDGEVE